ncbi:MAG: DUF3040 domain-containing protein [Actinomycetaceae bacterium]|nr:DUF3040 domain-containing protein [Actinomycetaceae bacterium]MDU0970033.1 DUF3040 domain-containing protein [Actinomycetaceae bacterium]
MVALSEHEREVLEQMEAEFRSEDPQFADSMQQAEEPQSLPRVTPRVWAAMVCLLLAGLVLLVVGVSLPYAVLGVIVAVLGFCLMVAGLSLPFAKMAKGRRQGKAAPSKRPPKSSGSFMDRQRDKWEHRDH